VLNRNLQCGPAGCCLSAEAMTKTVEQD
jgi:hypothetical protein